MSGVIPLLPVYTFMTGTGTTLCFYRVTFFIYLVFCVRKQDNLILLTLEVGQGVASMWHFGSELTTKIFIQVLKFTLLAYTNK
jgi:hypothetical protein